MQSTELGDENVLGPYVLTDRIGCGGMAMVHKARRRAADLQRPVVIKRILPEFARNPEVIEMFRTEARLLALLNHANIVQFLESGMVDGIPYIVMEHLEGWDLSRILMASKRRGRGLPIGLVLAIADQICRALGWAHELVLPEGERQQVIHRDISPANVMVCHDGSVKLLDFGIAKLTREHTSTRTALKGKHGYMAPEQVRGLPIDRRVDVFTTGIVLHEMLTGRRLFSARSVLETQRKIALGQVEPPSRYNPEVPPELDRVVQQALAVRPEDRYGSGAELAEALEALAIKRHSPTRLMRAMHELFAESDTSPEAHATDPFALSLVDEPYVSIELLDAQALEPIRTARGRVRPAPRPRRALTIGVAALVGGLAAAAVFLSTPTLPAAKVAHSIDQRSRSQPRSANVMPAKRASPVSSSNGTWNTDSGSR